ncbi:MAG: winged helix-turn-helix transcriptional regulator [Rhodobacteraceae bacterium]|nr:winged helix-turn-helix transcriptional regulator [Paracoccaceae bacterium]
MPDTPVDPYIALQFEVGIIHQIGIAFLEARLPDGLLVSHFSVVSHLVRVADGATPLQLAAAFQVPKTSMSHTLAGLQRRGLVDMRANPDDKRSKRVWLTQAGRQFRDDALAAMAPVSAEIAARFPREKIAQLLPGLAEFRAVIDRLRDEIS